MLAVIAVYLLTVSNLPAFVFSAVGAPVLVWGALRMRDDAVRPPRAAPRGAEAVPWDWTDFVLFWPGAFTAGQVLISLTVSITHSFTGGVDPAVRTAAEQFVGQAAYYAGAGFNLWVLVGLRRGGSLRDLGWRGFSWWWLPLAVAGAFATFEVAGVLQALMERAFPTLQNTQCIAVKHDYSHFLPLALIVVVLFAPVAEETVFRGFSYASLRALSPVPLALPASALIFALVHGVPLLIVPLFAVGCILAIFFEGSRSVFPGMLVHGLFNVPGIISILSAQTC